MKTLKLIIAGFAAAILIHSCSNDRDEEVRNEAIEQVKKTSAKEKIKLNNSGLQSREADPEAISDTIRVRGANEALGDNPDPKLEDGGDPKDVPPRK